MADHSVLRIDIDKKSPAFAATLFSWYVHPLRPKIVGASPPPFFTAIVFENAAHSYVHEDLSLLIDHFPRPVRDDHVIQQKTWYVIEAQLHVQVFERYAQRILIFSEKIEEDFIRTRYSLRNSDKIEWHDFSLDSVRDEKQTYGQKLIDALKRDDDRFMTALKEDIKKLLDRAVSPKFLDLSEQFHQRFDEQAQQSDEQTKRLDTIDHRTEEILKLLKPPRP